jgi:hypothetical protein
MASGDRPFEGDTQAVIFDAILNRDPRPLAEANPAMPEALGRSSRRLSRRTAASATRPRRS